MPLLKKKDYIGDSLIMSESVVTNFQNIHNWDDVPQFQSEAEEAEYWKTHGLAEDFFQPTSEMKRVLTLIQDLMNRLVDGLDKTYPSSESDITAENYLRLIRRNVEAVLHLASYDLRLIPSALVISRCLLETFGNLMWLIEPEKSSDRENRLIALIKCEVKDKNKYIKNLQELKEDATEFEKGRDYLNQILQEIQKRLGNDYDSNVEKPPSFEQLVNQINCKKLYPVYRQLSLSTHGNHAATWIYKREREGIEGFGEWIDAKDWQLPLYACYYTLVLAGYRFLERFGGDAETVFNDQTRQEIEKALTQLNS